MTEHLGSGTRTANGIPSSGSFFSRSQRATTRRLFQFQVVARRTWSRRRRGEGSGGETRGLWERSPFSTIYEIFPRGKGNIFSRNNGVLRFCRFLSFILSSNAIISRWERWWKKKKEKRKRNSCLNIYYSYYLQF